MKSQIFNIESLKIMVHPMFIILNQLYSLDAQGYNHKNLMHLMLYIFHLGGVLGFWDWIKYLIQS